MKKSTLPLSIILALSAAACSPDKTPSSNQESQEKQSSAESVVSKVSVSNPAGGAALPQLLRFPASAFDDDNAVTKKVTNFPSEWTKDQQGNDVLNVLVTLDAGEKATIALSDSAPDAPDVAYTELSVRQGGEWDGKEYKADGFSFENVDSFTAPPQLTDHSYYLRYEGPGWENDLVGYRLYLDWRNGTDIFVKTGNEPVLHQVGQDGYDSYHDLSDWGGDVLKVGKALGLGSFGRMEGDTVMHMQNVDEMSWALGHDDKLSAGFTVNYDGWDVNGKKLNASADYGIHAGDPSTTVTVSLSETADDLVTGIVKHDNTQYIELEMNGWGVIATYGKQSLLGEDDELGMALFYKVDDISRKFEAEYDYLIQFKPATTMEYQFMAVWPSHPDSPDDESGFTELLKTKLKALASPVTAG